MIRFKNGIRKEYFLILISCFFWAIGHPLGRIILEWIHPFQLGSMTLSTGFITLLVFLVASGKIKKVKKLSARDTAVSLGIGIFGFFFYQMLTFNALSRIPASMNAVLVSTNVVFIAILAGIFLKERLTPLRFMGIAVALGGSVLVTFNQGFTLQGEVDLLGCAFSLLAALSFAIYSILGKRVISSNDPLIVTGFALLSGAVLLALVTTFTVGFSEVAALPWKILLLTIFLGITMIGVAYPIWFICLSRLNASHVSVYIYLTPVFAVILSLVILKERFSWIFWVGAALILGGIFITNRFASKSSR